MTVFCVPVGGTDALHPQTAKTTRSYAGRTAARRTGLGAHALPSATSITPHLCFLSPCEGRETERTYLCNPQFDELVIMGRAADLSPLDLKRRALFKGKVKQVKDQAEPRKDSLLSARSCSLYRRVSQKVSLKDLLKARRSSADLLNMATAVSGRRASDGELSAGSGKADDAGDDSKPNLRRESWKMTPTETYYASLLAFRSLPFQNFSEDLPPKWPLPISSVNEDRFLTEIGLAFNDRYEIEGLQAGRRNASGQSGAHLASTAREKQWSATRAVVRVAANPPREVGTFQRRTVHWAIR